MIDFLKAQESFKEYLKAYNLKDEKIKLKIKHTYEVVKLSEYIARGLNLSKEDIELAKIIALLHDIGRFEQVKQTNGFSDSNKFNHAEYGAKVLFEDGIIRMFSNDNQYDEIIKKAIYKHNKYELEGKLSDQEMLHCKIIRDADKLDNFRVKIDERLENIFPNIYDDKTIEYEKISPKVYNDFMNHNCINTEDRKTQIDFWVCVIAFIFDLNFEISLQYVKDKDYIDILVDRIEYKNNDTKEKMKQIRQCAKKYLEYRNII